MTTTLTDRTLHVLERGRERIAHGWTQAGYRENRDGRECFCSIGALLPVPAPGKPTMRQFLDSAEARAAAEVLLEVLVVRGEGVGEWADLFRWNDKIGRTQGEALSLYDAAIRLVEFRQRVG